MPAGIGGSRTSDPVVEVGAIEKLIVVAGRCDPLFSPGLELGELDPEDCGLERVESAVADDRDVLVYTSLL